MRKPCPYIDPDVKEGVAEALAHSADQHNWFIRDRNRGLRDSGSYYGRFIEAAPEFIGWLKLSGIAVTKRT